MFSLVYSAYYFHQTNTNIDLRRVLLIIEFVSTQNFSQVLTLIGLHSVVLM